MSKNQLLKNLRHQLMRYALTLGMQKEDASDIVQNILLKALQKGFLETEEQIHLPYFKKMIKNNFIDQKRTRLTLYDDPQISCLSDDFTDEQEENALHKETESFLENHKYGYIIFEMEKRNIKHIKYLAPYTNEKAETLYKRYQKLVKDLEEILCRDGGMGLS